MKQRKERKKRKKERKERRRKGRKKKKTIMSKVIQELISNRIRCQKNLRKWIDKKKNNKNMYIY